MSNASCVSGQTGVGNGRQRHCRQDHQYHVVQKGATSYNFISCRFLWPCPLRYSCLRKVGGPACGGIHCGAESQSMEANMLGNVWLHHCRVTALLVSGRCSRMKRVSHVTILHRMRTLCSFCSISREVIFCSFFFYNGEFWQIVECEVLPSVVNAHFHCVVTSECFVRC